MAEAAKAVEAMVAVGNRLVVCGCEASAYESMACGYEACEDDVDDGGVAREGDVGGDYVACAHAENEDGDGAASSKLADQVWCTVRCSTPS